MAYDLTGFVPERLAREISDSDLDRTIRYKDAGVEKSVVVYADDPYACARIVLRPFIAVESTDEIGPGHFRAEIPLDSVMEVAVDRCESREFPPTEGENEPDYRDIPIPMARWVRHPDFGLVRLSIIDQVTG